MCSINFFFENGAPFDIMGEGEWGGISDSEWPLVTINCSAVKMSFACRVTKAKYPNTHSEYVIIIAFPQ